jgi:hypothetical protein
MAEFYKSDIPILDDARPVDRDTLRPGDVTFGLVPRDYSLYPQEYLGAPDEINVIEPSEWDARYDADEEAQSSLEHLFLRGGVPAFTNLDQNGDGYCWDYSNGHAAMLTRLRDRREPVRFNPHASAAIIKGGRNEGGWCGLGAKFAAEHGWAVEGTGPGQWPLHSRNLKYDTPALRAEMAKYRTTEEWRDLTKQDWDHTLTSKQLATCGFNNVPAPSDFNWWGHSVCQVRWVRIERGSWGPLILNSWKGWGRHGLAVLRGSQAVANGAVAVRTTSPTA